MPVSLRQGSLDGRGLHVSTRLRPQSLGSQPSVSPRRSPAGARRGRSLRPVLVVRGIGRHLPTTFRSRSRASPNAVHEPRADRRPGRRSRAGRMRPSRLHAPPAAHDRCRAGSRRARPFRRGSSPHLHRSAGSGLANADSGPCGRPGRSVIVTARVARRFRVEPMPADTARGAPPLARHMTRTPDSPTPRPSAGQRR